MLTGLVIVMVVTVRVVVISRSVVMVTNTSWSARPRVAKKRKVMMSVKRSRRCILSAEALYVLCDRMDVRESE